MNDIDADNFCERLKHRLEIDTPEEIVVGLAALVVRKDTFKQMDLYNAIFEVMASKLYLKAMQRKHK